MAIKYYDKTLAIDPKNVAALDGKGLTLDGLGNHTRAIEYFDKASAIYPKDIKALTYFYLPVKIKVKNREIYRLQTYL